MTTMTTTVMTNTLTVTTSSVTSMTSMTSTTSTAGSITRSITATSEGTTVTTEEITSSGRRRTVTTSTTTQVITSSATSGTSDVNLVVTTTTIVTTTVTTVTSITTSATRQETKMFSSCSCCSETRQKTCPNKMTWKPRSKRWKDKCIARDLSFQYFSTVKPLYSPLFRTRLLRWFRISAWTKAETPSFYLSQWSCFHGFHLRSKVHPEAHSKFNHKHQFEQWKLHDYIKYHNCYIHRIYHFSHFHRDIVYIYDLYQFHHYGHLLGRFWLHLGGGLNV